MKPTPGLKASSEHIRKQPIFFSTVLGFDFVKYLAAKVKKSSQFSVTCHSSST
jgi:hypothetical protein